MYILSFFRYVIKVAITDYPQKIDLRRDGVLRSELTATCSETSTSTTPPAVTIKCTASDTSTASYDANEIFFYVTVPVAPDRTAPRDVALIRTTLVTKASEDRLDVEVNLELKQAS